MTGALPGSQGGGWETASLATGSGWLISTLTYSFKSLYIGDMDGQTVDRQMMDAWIDTQIDG